MKHILEILDIKYFVPCIVPIIISYIITCLIGLLYNKVHKKSILGRRYILLTLLECMLFHILLKKYDHLEYASVMYVITMTIFLLGSNVFTGETDDPEAGKYFYTEYWAKGCPSDKPRYNIYICGEPLFEKRKSDGKVVLRKRRHND